MTQEELQTIRDEIEVFGERIVHQDYRMILPEDQRHLYEGC